MYIKCPNPQFEDTTIKIIVLISLILLNVNYCRFSRPHATFSICCQWKPTCYSLYRSFVTYLFHVHVCDVTVKHTNRRARTTICAMCVFGMFSSVYIFFNLFVGLMHSENLVAKKQAFL